jgi:DedD protein
MAEAQDVETLKRRGRRRLVGAVALVLLAVIALPMVFDPEPQSSAPPVSVRIPGENDAPFAPKPAPKPAAKPAPKPAPKAPAQAAKAPAEEYIVQVGAFSNPEAVLAKLAAAKLPYYTEAIKGNLTRVRAGPFPSKEAAEKALERLKALGLDPGSVSTKSG